MTVAMVLSGGASLGSAQVGMMQAVSESGVQPDLIVGTSVGAVNGAWMATGKPLDGLADVWRRLDRDDVFPPSPTTSALALLCHSDHFISNGSLRRILRKQINFKRLEDAKVPLHVIATDVLSGMDVKLSDGPAIDAVLASSAIPGIYPPIEIEGRPLMDGGVVNNTPISHAVALGAKTVWVLASGYPCALDEAPRSALGMILHALTLSIHHRLAMDIDFYADAVDLRVVPPLCPLDVGPADFSRGAKLIERAYLHTRGWLQSTDDGREAIAQGGTVFGHGHSHS